MRKCFALSFSSILICLSSAIQADEASINVDAAILGMHQEINQLVNVNNTLKNQIELLQEAQKITNQQIKELFIMLEVDTTRKIVEHPMFMKKEDEDKASALYADGRKQLIFGSHDTAIKLFQDYLTTYPNYKNVADSKYWLGRAFFAKKSYSKSKEIFVKFQQENPLHPKFANSMYELAQALVELGEVEAAKIMLSEMLDKFPTHSLRIRAENKLNNLQALASES
jgi:tol-pal system protein YbgF